MPDLPDAWHARLLYRVAKAYYDDDLTQGEIGARFGLSRVKVCRLLAQARERGVVRISITPPGGALGDLERSLERRFELQEVVLAPEGRAGPALERVGAAAAALVARTLTGTEVVGVSWGQSLRAVVEAMPTLRWPALTVVQVIGGLGSVEEGVNGAELARRLAERCGARPRLLHAPGVVASAEVRSALLDDAQIAETLALGRRAGVALLGVGVPSRTSTLLGPGALLTRAELTRLVERGAVGDVALRYFDRSGSFLATELDRRVVGLAPDELLAIPHRIGVVAAGPGKLEALRAALAGGLLTVLVTDAATGAALLEGG